MLKTNYLETVLHGAVIVRARVLCFFLGQQTEETK